MNREIILASSSPRRAELLEQIGLRFRIFCSDVDETPPPGLNPSQLVELLAERKAAGIAGQLGEGIVLGADTVVVWQGQLLGKPLHEEEAVRMLSKLQGSAHEVYTGLALIEAGSGRRLVDHEKTVVYFRSLGENEIRRYAATGEPLDKAGAYAVQGLAAIFIHRLEGCYSNVVGLPLSRLALMLREFGYEVL